MTPSCIVFFWPIYFHSDVPEQNYAEFEPGLCPPLAERAVWPIEYGSPSISFRHSYTC